MMVKKMLLEADPESADKPSTPTMTISSTTWKKVKMVSSIAHTIPKKSKNAHESLVLTGKSGRNGHLAARNAEAAKDSPNENENVLTETLSDMMVVKATTSNTKNATNTSNVPRGPVGQHLLSVTILVIRKLGNVTEQDTANTDSSAVSVVPMNVECRLHLAKFVISQSPDLECMSDELRSPSESA